MEFLLGAGALFEPGTQSFEFGDITAEGERAVLEWRVRGRAAATGKDYDNSYCGVFVIRQGRITEDREYLDSRHAGETLFGADFQAADSQPGDSQPGDSQAADSRAADSQAEV
jgi:hypothetical protein